MIETRQISQPHFSADPIRLALHVWRFVCWMARRLFEDGNGVSFILGQHTLLRLRISFMDLEWMVLGLALAWSVLWTLRNRHVSGAGRLFASIARRRSLAIIVVFFVTVAGRAIMLNTNPLPQPYVHDEFSYLLAGDTYSHFRLTNPTPPFWPHFVTFHELMVPTYMSKYPPGQGLCLAFGILIFHSAAIAVILTSAAMAAALCWQLQAMAPPAWALFGGLLAAIRLGTISYWSDSYWGGSLTALAGCLLLGAAVRWAKKPSSYMAALAAVSAVLVVNCRPFEGGILVVGLWIYLLWERKKGSRGIFSARTLAPFLMVMTLGAAGMAVNNWVVTGNPFRLPYVLYSQESGTVPAFFFQKAPPAPKVYLYEAQRKFHAWEEQPYREQRTVKGFIRTQLIDKLPLCFQFLIGPSFLLLLFGLPAAMVRRKDRPFAVLLGCFAVALVVETWCQPHYFAPAVGVAYLFLVSSARHLNSWRRSKMAGVALVRTVGLACLLSLLVRVFVHPGGSIFSSWAGGASHDWGRPRVLERLKCEPGRHLVMVSYGADHDFLDEWVYNSANPDSQKVVWAHSLSSQSDFQIECYFANRHLWHVMSDGGEDGQEKYVLESLPPPNCGR